MTTTTQEKAERRAARKRAHAQRQDEWREETEWKFAEAGRINFARKAARANAKTQADIPLFAAQEQVTAADMYWKWRRDKAINVEHFARIEAWKILGWFIEQRMERAARALVDPETFARVKALRMACPASPEYGMDIWRRELMTSDEGRTALARIDADRRRAEPPEGGVE